MLIVLQIGFSKQYDTYILGLAALLSFCLSIGVTILLAYRFIAWVKYSHDVVIAAYAAAIIILTVNSIVSVAAMSLEMQKARTIIDFSRVSTSTANTSNFELKEFESNLSAVTFVALWFASTLLLRQNRATWGRIKFYSIVILPLLYYFGIFQLIFTQVIMQYDVLSAVRSYTFNIISSSLTRPIGGILFGIAFWVIARSIGNKNVSDYMKLSAFGIMLLSIASEDVGLFMLTYPPFGIATVTFMGISSYLLFVGIYYSAISVSLDVKLKSSIQKSVEQQLRFVSNIGASEVEQDIQQKVKYLTKKVAHRLEEESGVVVPLEDEEVDRYIKIVIDEKERLSKKKMNKHIDAAIIHGVTEVLKLGVKGSLVYRI